MADDLGNLLKATRRSRRTRRRRVHPALWVLLGAGALAGIGWLWFWVFSPLFTSPDEWIAREKRFRREIARVVSGQADGLPAAPDLPAWPPALTDAQARVLACAEGQVARGVKFSSRYYRMRYPWGDLPDYLATAPDILIRCLRATGLDLQQMIHIDRVKYPDRYPIHIWANRRPDRSVDHRRLPNLFTFIRTYSKKLPVLTDSPKKLVGFQPGDLVFFVAPGGGDYPGFTGIVTDRRDGRGVPYIVTLVRKERRISDHHRLNDWQVSGHFRIDPDDLLDRFLQANPQGELAPLVETEAEPDDQPR